jgi:capsular polysaccharide transport system permease protein
MVTLILVPVILAILYLTYVATPRYMAESRFLVRTNDQQSHTPRNNVTSLISTGGSTSSGLVDGWAVNRFLGSRDAMHQLDRKIGLRRYLTNTTLDPVNRLMPEASDDALYETYQARVKVSYNMQEQINLITVSAFSPGDAQVISLALLDLAQQFVHNMDEKGIADALNVSQQAVTLAEQQARLARAELANWRIKNGNIDPAADAKMQLTLISQLESELNIAHINLYKIRALGNPNHPMMQATKMQISALQKRQADVRQRLSSLGDTEVNRLKTYEELKNAQLFADASLDTARQNYHQSFISTLRLQRYLNIIVHPEPGDRPSSPNALLILLEALALGLLLAFIYRIIAGAYRAFRYS